MKEKIKRGETNLSILLRSAVSNPRVDMSVVIAGISDDLGNCKRLIRFSLAQCGLCNTKSAKSISRVLEISTTLEVKYLFCICVCTLSLYKNCTFYA